MQSRATAEAEGLLCLFVQYHTLASSASYSVFLSVILVSRGRAQPAEALSEAEGEAH
jgi:hypothetical protein